MRLRASRCFLALAAFAISLPLTAQAPKRVMATPAGMKEIPAIVNEESSWSPDGKRIAFDSDRADGKRTQIYVVNLADNAIARLTDVAANDITPAWSPDGRRIAFTSDRSGKNEIFVMDADGQNVRQLTYDKSDNIHPSWSPDGKEIIFCSAKDNTDQREAAEGERYEIYLIGADGGNERRLTNFGGVNTFPNYSPGGKKIAFRKLLPEKNSEVWVMDADGSNAKNLTNNPAFDGWAHWSPDGSRIVFASNRSGTYEIYIMKADGSGARAITDLGGRATSPKWSPDGTKISFDEAISMQCHILIVDAK